MKSSDVWESGSIRKTLKVLSLVFPEKQLPSKAMKRWLKGASGPPNPTEQGH